MDIITSHISADFDALASAMAAKKLYPDAVIVFPGSMEKKVRDFFDAFQPMEIKKIKDIQLKQVKRLILVDTKHADRIGNFKELLSRKDVKIHIYDHHPINESDIRGEMEVIEHVGAVSTIFAEIIQKKKIPLTPMEATVLCLGIYEETGSLTYTSTTPRDLTAVSYLLKRGANLNIVSNFLRIEMSREELVLLNDLVQSLKEVVVQGVRIKIAKGRIEGFGDVAHLAHKIMDMEDTDAIVLLIGMADKILMVARSKAPELDVSQVLSEFEGGGHPTAASATIKDMPFEIVEERLIESLKKHARPMKSARDVMTAPVVVTRWNSEIKEAEGMMTRYGVNVLPVVKKDKYMGILTREVVEKALFHGFGKSGCIDFATTDAVTVSPDTPVSDVERFVIEKNQRFIPVLKGDRIVGAITRTDILRAIYEDFLKKSRVFSKEALTGEYSTGAAGVFGRNVAGVLKERLPSYLYEFLENAGEAADELKIGAYLVGGCVRDIMRGEENLDIDIVVEGDGIAFANKLGESIGAKVTAHHRFGTAHLKAEGSRIDIASARTEYYESPAVLPTVEMSSIKKDLYRRDFTINTLAVRLNKKDFGLLIDFFGAQRDLKDKAIRVLHNLSFIEDPTRAFRAVRFAERFGFKLTKHTENLIKSAIRMNIFEKLSGTRLYDELMLTFSETNPIKTLKRLGDYDLLKVINSKLSFSPELEALLQSAHDTITWFELLFLKEKCDRGMLYIMALLYKLDKEERESALKRLSVTSRLKDRILNGFQAAHETLRYLKPGSLVETYHLLIGHDIESVLFSMALTQDNEKKKAISHFLLELRNVKPLLKGSDLKKLGIPPGPEYSKILKKILDEKLMKRLQTKEEEIEFVKRMIR
ncbi:MAG: CBS domain-containing protein [Nitrospirae bacterium]|nr:CBS domain-containing protein [Nitrospirota bacterium]MCL5978358.1 CBS domain-containing protein [Nitrospirota bacterium]